MAAEDQAKKVKKLGAIEQGLADTYAHDVGKFDAYVEELSNKADKLSEFGEDMNTAKFASNLAEVVIKEGAKVKEAFDAEQMYKERSEAELKMLDGLNSLEQMEPEKRLEAIKRLRDDALNTVKGSDKYSPALRARVGNTYLKNVEAQLGVALKTEIRLAGQRAAVETKEAYNLYENCLLYTSPSPRDS